MNSRPLNHILKANARSLEADLTQFAQLDDSLHDIPVSLGHESFELSFERGKAQNGGFTFDGVVTFPNHIKERIQLITAKAGKDDVQLEFTQDVDLQGKPKVYSYKPSENEKKEYNSLRNSLFHELHSLIATEYSGNNSARLIRKRFKQVS